MTRHEFLVSMLILIAAAAGVGAQEARGPEVETAGENPIFAIKVDEFGAVGNCDFSARIDNLYIQLQNYADATAYIITYRSADALPGDRDRDRMAANATAHLRMRGLDTSRIVFIEGGFRPDIGAELFIVPFGGVPPEPSETVERPEIPEGTYLWSEGVIGLYSDFEESLLEEFTLPAVLQRREEEMRQQEIEWEMERARDNLENGDEAPVYVDEEAEEEPEDEAEEELSPEEIYETRFSWINDGIATQVASKEASRAVMIFYADDQEFDIAKLEGFVKEGRDKIAREAGIDPALIEVVFGGYQDQPSAEYYFVPENGETPQPKPHERVIEADVGEQE